MKSLSSVLKKTLIISIVIYVLIVLPLIAIQYNNMQKTMEVVDETELVLQNLEHLLEAVHQDNILVQQYLLTEDLEVLDILEIELDVLQKTCEDLTQQTLLSYGESINQDPEIKHALELGNLLYGSLERARSQLLEAHKDYVFGSGSFSKVESIQERYTSLLADSTQELTGAMQLLREKSVKAHVEISQENLNSVYRLTFLGLFFLVFILATSFIYYRLFVTPITNLNRNLKEFSEGKYSTRINEDSKIEEYNYLIKNTNAVFDILEDQSKQPKVKKLLDEKLLAPKYAKLLEYIDKRADEGVTVRIKDLKTEFNLTHPTIKAYIKYLEQRNLISVVNQGREKLILRNKIAKK